jgi:HlyD family secretion protein
MRSKKLWIVVAAAVVVLVFVVVNLKSRRKLPEVDVDKVTRGPVREVVNASGTLNAKTYVDVSATIMGKITKLAVHEGDQVRQGDLLMEIDPKEYESLARGAEAGLASAQEELALARANLDKAELDVKRARSLREQGLQTQEQVEVAETNYKVQQAQVAAATGRVGAAQANLDRTRNELSKVTIKAPISGTVTRLNIHEGENAIIGTMNNPGTLLLTVDDLSQMEAKVKVDETEVVKVKAGQPADITIDAYPDSTFKGVVTEVGNSPIFSQTGIGQQAVDFEVKIMLQNAPEKVRPGLSASANIEVASRPAALTIPIASLVSRDWPPAEKGKAGARGKRGGRDAKSQEQAPAPAASADATDKPADKSADKPADKSADKPADKSADKSEDNAAGKPQDEATDKPGAKAGEVGQAPSSATDSTAASDGKTTKKPKKKEGVFIVAKAGVLEFRPVKVGIAGEERFEVVYGLDQGATVVSGPFRILRDLQDGDRVKIVDATKKKGAGGKSGGDADGKSGSKDSEKGDEGGGRR